MSEILKNRTAELAEQVAGKDPIEALSLLANAFPGKVIFSTSFSWEDQAISHLILTNNIPIKIFTLDTGRLFPETYYVWSRTNEQYGANIHAYYPNQTLLENFITEKGPNSFYESIDNLSLIHI